MKKSYPAISVIIPMYNTEKYIGECLDCLLLQTFQDFEVIVVNDCSTDSSRQIAELYLEKFGGRMKIHDNEKNSGPGASRNNGLLMASGEYIFFMDSDDLILTYAFEDFYNIAKKHNADVIMCPHNYNISADGKDVVAQIDHPVFHAKDIVEEDFKWRLEKILVGGIPNYTPWRKFSRRRLLIDNKLFFNEDFYIYEDRIWAYGLYLCARKVVHLAKPYYLYRLTDNSLLRAKKNPAKEITEILLAMVEGVRWIDEIMNRINYFRQNPQQRCAVFISFLKRFYYRIQNQNLKVKPAELYGAILDHFGEKLGERDTLIAALFTYINSQQKEITNLKEQLKNK